jgi:hypothetical protein
LQYVIRICGIAKPYMVITQVKVVQKHGMDDPNFKGFMANNTHANWNALRKIFGYGDPTIAMFGKECTCLFSLDLVCGKAY